MPAGPRPTPFTLRIVDDPGGDPGELGRDEPGPAGAGRPALGRLGRYELLTLLAEGGMGEVYLARARSVGGFEKLVVIKRSLPSLAADREPLFAEARLVATLQHTNIVQVYDVDTDGPTVFMAMEFLHGQDVRHVLRRAWRGDRRLPLDHALAIAQAVCAGLHYAHEKRDADGTPLGIVHRDVSPSNVFVTYDGGVKLIDFGIAKATSLPSETQLGTIKGKPGYMSPEQCRGEPLDRRSDLFCVGILLYELTTGRRPFRGETEYMIYREICEGERARPTASDPTYPPALEAIVLRALAPDRRDRHPTALALQEELARFAGELRLDTSQWALQRCMAELFRDELAAWHEAQRTGHSLVEHMIRRVTGSVAALEGPEPTEPPRAVPDRGARPADRSSMAVTAVRDEPARAPRWWPRAAAVAVVLLAAGAAALAALSQGGDPRTDVAAPTGSARADLPPASGEPASAPSGPAPAAPPPAPAEVPPAPTEVPPAPTEVAPTPAEIAPAPSGSAATATRASPAPRGTSAPPARIRRPATPPRASRPPARPTAGSAAKVLGPDDPID